MPTESKTNLTSLRRSGIRKFGEKRKKEKKGEIEESLVPDIWDRNKREIMLQEPKVTWHLSYGPHTQPSSRYSQTHF